MCYNFRYVTLFYSHGTYHICNIQNAMPAVNLVENVVFTFYDFKYVT